MDWLGVQAQISFPGESRTPSNTPCHWTPLQVGNANPAGIFQSQVYRFDGLQTWRPGTPWAAGSYYTKWTNVSGRLASWEP